MKCIDRLHDFRCSVATPREPLSICHGLGGMYVSTSAKRCWESCLTRGDIEKTTACPCFKQAWQLAALSGECLGGFKNIFREFDMCYHGMCTKCFPPLTLLPSLPS